MLSMQKLTKIVPSKDQVLKWFIIDCSGERLGKVSTTIIKSLLGKSEPMAVDYMKNPVAIIAINTDKISYFPTRAKNKMYYRHSGFPGGLKQISLGDQMEKDSTKILWMALNGMLPKNRLRDLYLANVHIFKNAEHPHIAQQPKVLTVA